jgi:membrane dipeptidase
MEHVSAEALDLHRKAIVFDGHCDTILNLDRSGRALGEHSPDGHADLPRFRLGGTTAQVFALYVEGNYLPDRAIQRTLQLLDRFYQELASNQDRMLQATRAADIHRAKAEDKLAAILGIEGGAALAGEISALRAFYRLGVRLLTLTWSRRNELGDGTGVENPQGLTDFGREIVLEMNRLGMIIDVSHLAPPGLRDVLATSQAPVVASHSNARALCDHARNLTDEQARGIAETGGIIGVTFVPPFVASQGASLERLLDHIAHLLKVAGEDHVGIGSDYDGFGFGDPARQFHDMPDVSTLPRLTDGMLQRGLAEPVVEKVLGLNWLRVFDQVVGP